MNKVINDLLISLRQGKLDLLNNNTILFINNIVLQILDKESLTQEELQDAKAILNISNILYNNTDRDLLVLEDGIYDKILELYKRYDPNFQVGAEPITFNKISADNLNNKKEIIRPLRFLPKDKINELNYKKELFTSPSMTKEDYLINPFIFNPTGLSRRSYNTSHKYPKLVGTLDKAKFVLNIQAEQKGVLNDSNIQILERDFFAKHIQMGILDPNRRFKMVLELKYDGVSVEAEVSNTVLNARQRGDTNNDLTSDITPIIGGYIFKHAKEIPANNIFGMKFEAIMTYANLYRYNIARNKEYKNCRTAIISVFNSLDGYKFKDLITLVPLATSMENVDRLTEIQFMNQYYHSGEYLRYAVIQGNYIEILFQIKQFVEEAEYLREFMPFMYDGVVVSYIEPDLIDALGRVNSINKYSIAVKFNPLKKLTKFVGYTFTVGQNGVITPMIHFMPVEFYGTIHTKSSGHSLDRFNSLELREGDIIEAEYVNDVMPYITKPTNDNNDNNTNPIIEFVKECPYCGTPIVHSKSGRSAMCPNIQCPERNKKRITALLQKLNLKDFGEEYLSQIAVYSLKELLNLTIKDVEFLGELNSQKFIERMNELRTVSIPDYKIIGSLGFTDVAAEKWKLIMNKINLVELLEMDLLTIRTLLSNIKGIGPVTIDTICDELDFFREDLITIANMPNIVISKGQASAKSIRFTGVRDQELVDRLNNMGYDANGDAGVTKKTDILIVPIAGHTSSKTKKAGPNTVIVPIQEFKDNMSKYL